MRIWHGLLYHYPKGRQPVEDLFSFKLVDEGGDFLEFGENLPSIFRTFETVGYPNVRLILRKEPDPKVKCEKSIWVFRHGGKIFFTDGFKTVSTRDKEWQNVLLKLFYCKLNQRPQN